MATLENTILTLLRIQGDKTVKQLVTAINRTGQFVDEETVYKGLVCLREERHVDRVKRHWRIVKPANVQSVAPRDNYFGQELKRLLDVTNGCRPDMHEPDEQGVGAEFGPRYNNLDGGKDRYRAELDNAFTQPPDGQLPTGMGIWITREDDKGNKTREWFNLANLIALARCAKLSY